VQSMRSGTYVHPGEQLTCLGTPLTGKSGKYA